MKKFCIWVLMSGRLCGKPVKKGSVWCPPHDAQAKLEGTEGDELE